MQIQSQISVAILWFFLHLSNGIAQGDNCTDAIDLSTQTSPYTGSTLSMANDFSTCVMGSANDMIFYIDVPDGMQLTIGQTSNTYDSRHSLRYLGSCPGTTEIVCTDDPDTQTETWLNTSGSLQRVWYIQSGYSSGSGSFTIAWNVSLPPPDNCSSAYNLCSLTSPYTSTTTGASNDFSVCTMGSSEDLIFYIDIPNGETLTIGQVSNTYDSRHTLRYGGSCPGATEIVCTDDPDTQTEVWTNLTGATQRVYWIQGGYSTNDGDFTLAWSATGACAPPTCNDPSSLGVTNVGPDQVDLSWTENGTASTWDIELGSNGFTPSGIPTQNDVNSDPYTYMGLTPSTSYDYYVRSNCDGLQSNWVGPYIFTTNSCNIQSPSGLTASNINSASADLNWTENGNASIWDVELGINGFIPTGTPTANNITNTPYTYSGLIGTTSYDYYVRAKCGGANSSWVGPYTFTTPSFPNNYTSEMSDGWARSVVQDAGGNYVWAGYTNLAGSQDMYVVKTDQGSNVIWTKTIGDVGTDYAFDIVNSGDGGYVVAGVTNSATLTSGGNYDIMVVKLDANGNHVWTTVFGTSSSDYSYEKLSIVKNQDGTFCIASSCTSLGNNKMQIHMLNASGTLINSKELTGASGSEGMALVQATGTNGGWVVAGTKRNGTGDDYLVTKIKSDGTYDWSMSWGDGAGNNEYIHAIVENAPDDYTVFGSTYAEGTSPCNIYAMRFTNSGGGAAVIWTKTYGTSNTSIANDAVVDVNGDYIITGYEADGAYTDTYLIKIDEATGDIIWQTKKLDDGTANRQGDGVIIDASLSYLVAGLGGYDMLKFAPDGSICNGVTGTMTTDNLSAPTFNTAVGSSNSSFGVSSASRTPILGSGGSKVDGCNITPLPVELISFYGLNDVGYNELKWRTASELNTSHFIIEKSSNGREFEYLASVEAAQNSTTLHNYSIIDYSPYLVSYYRMSVYNFNGEREYTKTIVIKLDEEYEDRVGKVFPNPTNSGFSFQLNDVPSKSDLILMVYNSIGMLCVQKEFGNLRSNTVEFVNTSNWAPGVYKLVFVFGDVYEVQKIVIVK